MLVVGIFVEPTRPTAPALSTFGQPNMTFGVRDISLKHNHGGELLPDGFIQKWDLLAHWDSEATFGGDWMEQVAKFPANNSVPFTPTASPLAPAPWPQLPLRRPPTLSRAAAGRLRSRRPKQSGHRAVDGVENGLIEWVFRFRIPATKALLGWDSVSQTCHFPSWEGPETLRLRSAGPGIRSKRELIACPMTTFDLWQLLIW